MSHDLLPGPTPHGDTRIRSLEGDATALNFATIEIETPRPQWAYAVSFRIECPDLAAGTADSRLCAVVDIEVRRGAVAIGSMSPDFQAFTAREIIERTGPRRTVHVPVDAPTGVCALMIRNAADGGTASTAKVFNLEVRHVPREERNAVTLKNTMTPHQLKNYQDYAPPRVFSVVSWGAAATDWLACVLNDCPSIFCVHAANSYWETFADGKALSGLRYLQIIGMLGHSAALAGDVHGISRYDIPAIREFFGDQFNAVVLVRDPLARLRSVLALNERYEPTLNTNTSYLDAQLPRALALLPTGRSEERMFVHSANLLNAVIDEQAVGPIFRMEDVVSRPESLFHLVEVLSAGAVRAPERWGASSMSRGATNCHKRADSRAFCDWQMQVLRSTIRPEATHIYQELGYDMNWLQAPR